MPSRAIVSWSWWMSPSDGISTMSGAISAFAATRISRISCRTVGKVRTSKSWIETRSGSMPRAVVAARASCTSVSAGNPSGSERDADEKAW